jgi:hypothetical protein
MSPSECGFDTIIPRNACRASAGSLARLDDATVLERRLDHRDMHPIVSASRV